MGIIVGGQELDTPEGLVVKNFNDPVVFHFKNQVRPTKTVTEVIVHETVTRSWSSTVDVLKQRGLGVHFIADSDGTVYQHADLLDEEMWHASQHNGMSVGIETVNPYEPDTAPPGGPWMNVLDNVPWSASQHPPRKYVVPTPEQAESVCQLLNWLTSAAANPLTIPQKWPGLVQSGAKTTLALSRVAACATPPEPGVLAHMYFGHGDGAWLVLYAWLRLEAGLDAATGYAEAQRRAQGVMAADVSDYFAQNPFLVV
jgi:hypothetical protein